MIIRIVKMRFKKEHLEDFKAVFERSKPTIRAFKGCRFLELYQDIHDSRLFFTYSYWDSEAALDAYRNSDFFTGLWTKTKGLFSEKAEAWSVDKIESLP